MAQIIIDQNVSIIMRVLVVVKCVELITNGLFLITATWSLLHEKKRWE